MPDGADRPPPPVPQVVERLPDLACEGMGNGSVLVLVPQWRDKLPDARPRRLAFPVSHLANVLRPADLDELGFIGRIRVVRPFPKGLIAGQMPLYRLAGLGRVDLADARGSGHRQQTGDQPEVAPLAPPGHLVPRPRPSNPLARPPPPPQTSPTIAIS